MKSIDYREMGSRIRKQRELLGYTREQVAEKLDVSTKFCSDIELGVRGVSIQTLAKLTDILNLSADYILFGECIHGNSAELETLFLFGRKCPEKHLENLITIVSTFIDSVSE
ncbi:MAG: helix-turn-helix transcriptional regulator [Ruminococcus sp.]|nr:helix-turn-helix transcriptional regulator [Ruminococcus sp.]